jgi:hypothetical protein
VDRFLCIGQPMIIGRTEWRACMFERNVCFWKCGL